MPSPKLPPAETPLSPSSEPHPAPHTPKPDSQVHPISPPGNVPHSEPSTHMAATSTLSTSPSVSNQVSSRHDYRRPAQRHNTPNGVHAEPPPKRRRTGAEPHSASPMSLPPSAAAGDMHASVSHRSQPGSLEESRRDPVPSKAPDSRPTRVEESWPATQTPTPAVHELSTAAVNDANADKPSPNDDTRVRYRAPSENVASEDSRPAIPVQPLSSAVSKNARRIWNHRVLQKSGVSTEAFHALELFVKTIPPIPIQPDHNRRQMRNMRGWIQQLEKPSCDAMWDQLMEALRKDTGPQGALGRHWDHDVCRFILGHVVSENQTSQTRQAMNNAIKRELICPTESGNSTRGKTFRDLFREKCHKANVKLNALENAAYPKRSSHASNPGRHSSTTPADPLHRYAVEHEDSFASRGRATDGRISEAELKKLRELCPHKDEWGRSAWWKLESDEDVKFLPELLVYFRLYELRDLLIDFRWIMRMFRCVNFSEGMFLAPARAYDVILRYAMSPSSQLPLPDVESFRLIRNAIMVILPVLYKDKARATEHGFHAHLATQLTGRLLSLKRKFPTVACLIQSIELYAPKPWLKPLTRCFRQPRTDIALAVPSEGIVVPHQIALSDDGKFLVTMNKSSRKQLHKKAAVKGGAAPAGLRDDAENKPAAASLQRTPSSSSISVWEVRTGKRVVEVCNVGERVSHVAITKDNNCIIGGTNEDIFFWHLDKGNTWTAGAARQGHPPARGLSSIRPTSNPRRVLTAHKIEGKSVILEWDTQTGSREKVYDAVESKPNCIDIHSLRGYFASGHDNGFIHLWNLSDDNNDTPILTFKDEGDRQGAQNGVSLVDANKEKDSGSVFGLGSGTISISFLEKEDDLSLASISSKRGDKQHWIRIWVLPPQKFLDGSSQAFVSCKRVAVWQCKLARQILCSGDGKLFTGGDDEVGRMWEREEGGKWKQYTMEMDGSGDWSMWSTFICCGKRTKLMATYVSKSPYVDVWDTRNKDLRRKMMTRTGVYRSYMSLEPQSVDVGDMDQYQFLRPGKDADEFGEGAGRQRRRARSTSAGARRCGRSAGFSCRCGRRTASRWCGAGGCSAGWN